jgi:hypothetical protein
MLGMPRFRLGCMRPTGESTRTSLNSLASPLMLVSEVHGGCEQHEGQCGRAPVR